MRIYSKIFRGGANCSVCGDNVQNLYALHEIEDKNTGTCGRCLCNHIMQLKYDIVSSKKVRVTERLDALCPKCGANELVATIESRNLSSVGAYFVKAICGHCGMIYTAGSNTLDNAMVETDVDTGLLTIVPLDDCMIEIKWSSDHNRLVAVVRDVPSRD